LLGLRVSSKWKWRSSSLWSYCLSCRVPKILWYKGDCCRSQQNLTQTMLLQLLVGWSLQISGVSWSNHSYFFQFLYCFLFSSLYLFVVKFIFIFMFYWVFSLFFDLVCKLIDVCICNQRSVYKEFFDTTKLLVGFQVWLVKCPTSHMNR